MATPLGARRVIHEYPWGTKSPYGDGLISISSAGAGNTLEIKKIKSAEELERAKMSGPVLVDFGAPWCAPCHLQDPIIYQLSEQFEGKASIVEVNIDESRELASNMGIRSIPTLILFSSGKEIQRFIGLQSEVTLSEALKKLVR